MTIIVTHTEAKQEKVIKTQQVFCDAVNCSLPFGFSDRAALLTGRYQTRSGIYPGVFNPQNTGGM